MPSPIRRTRGGGFDLRLTSQERELLGSLPGQLRELLESEDASTARLFPPAYGDDREKSEEFARLVRDDLMVERLERLRVVEETVGARRLTGEQLQAWLGAVNDLRLVLGTRLDVTEEMYEEGLPEGDPRTPAFAVFAYLGWLEEHIVEALAGSS